MPEQPASGAAPRLGTVLAFDFGARRIGVAVGETLLGQAHPLTVIDAVERDLRFAAIARLIEEWQPQQLVVGLPAHLDPDNHTPHAVAARCTRFANQLRGRFGLPVALADERLSSYEAEQRLRESGHHGRQARPHLDAMAAQVILQSYFDAHPTTP